MTKDRFLYYSEGWVKICGACISKIPSTVYAPNSPNQPIFNIEDKAYLEQEARTMGMEEVPKKCLLCKEVK